MWSSTHATGCTVHVSSHLPLPPKHLRANNCEVNWYKVRHVNYLDEKDSLAESPADINVPYLFVAATHDMALPPSMAKHQGKFIPNLTTRELKSSHWVMEETPETLLVILKEWLDKVVFGPKSKI
jgi:soluble epoxide hydrolase/lipid-phosphate phosphatase